jgi:hypothetical protein
MSALFLICRSPGNGFLFVVFMIFLTPAVAGFFLARWIVLKNPFEIRVRSRNILLAVVTFLFMAALPFLLLWSLAN